MMTPLLVGDMQSIQSMGLWNASMQPIEMWSWPFDWTRNGFMVLNSNLLDDLVNGWQVGWQSTAGLHSSSSA
jgi:hypothetical protein